MGIIPDQETQIPRRGLVVTSRPAVGEAANLPALLVKIAGTSAPRPASACQAWQTWFLRGVLSQGQCFLVPAKGPGNKDMTCNSASSQVNLASTHASSQDKSCEEAELKHGVNPELDHAFVRLAFHRRYI